MTTDGELNPAQWEAVNTLSGPLLVLAGAGTGKTRVITYRIVQLIKAGVAPSRILGVTFTNKAAHEMLERARALLQESGLAGRGRAAKMGRPLLATFHAYGLQVLRRHIHRVGYPPHFSICDRAEQVEIARLVLRELRSGSAALSPEEMLWWISRWKTEGVDPAEAAARAACDKEHLAASAYRRYAETLRLRAIVDFDDLLVLVDKLFREFPEVLAEESGRFDHLLIDEYQDTNDVQYRIARALALRHRNLCVVGDDDQSIYSWRGAQPRHILRFKEDWPDAKVVILRENYRSTGPILSWANRLISFNTSRHVKELFSPRSGPEPRILQASDGDHEAELVASVIADRLRRGEAQPRDFAILCRTNDQMRPFEIALRQARIPYVLVGGQSFYDRKEVKDILAYLKVIIHPQDDLAILRIINTPPRGIGRQTVTAILEQALGRGQAIWEVLVAEEFSPTLAESAREKLRQFRELISRFAARAQEAPGPAVVKGLVDEIGYCQEVERLYADPTEREARLATVDQLCQSLETYWRNADEPSLSGFLHNVTLESLEDAPDPEDQLRRNAVALMTLHAAKGLEFPVVFLVGMEEGILPHRHNLAAQDSESLEEERRLCYVGMTRAKRELFLTFAVARLKRGKLVESVPSRFLYEAAGKTEHPGYQDALCGITRTEREKLKAAKKLRPRGRLRKRKSP
ncbi:MAG: exodeoxyribonuclease V subunit gamma [Thermoguttaceae bacterium]|nr:exodeoxyribonuclease V subunit gamma [Thermoguttaceae bacterium]MDW8078103.1 UvrD-helicase domain-containing protein [Thermoguttaceae bacterium]